MYIIRFEDRRQQTSWGIRCAAGVLDIPTAARQAGRAVHASPDDMFRALGLKAAKAELESLSELAHEDCLRDQSQLRLLAPVARPEKIIGVGRNYRDHVSEGALALPKWPKLFPKFPSAIIGPEETIIRPALTAQLDFEVEVAVVIGDRIHQVTIEQAMDAVAGYTIINDISARDIQFTDEQITLGKNFDTFCPMGPALVTPEDMPDPNQIGLWLLLNGAEMQRATTGQLIFPIPYLVSFISSVMTLKPGDVICTGTPAGVGAFREPPIWLQGGDKIECHVERIGSLVNYVSVEQERPA